ncbi:MAG: DUF692 domain-containing protein [Pseudomonadota bacterium]
MSEPKRSKVCWVAAKVPARVGLSLKPQHYQDILDGHPNIGWFEIHAENYMGDGGAPHHYLSRVREDYPLSMHGVGLSIGSAGDLDKAHLQRLTALNTRYEPGLVSEHLAWSSHDSLYFPDLLPVPYTAETLRRVAEHVEQVQDALKRIILLENPSSYLSFESSTLSETDFLRELAARTGCGLLLDVNNVMVSATNLNFSAEAYMDAFPLDKVGQIHLAGHASDQDETGAEVLIDSHDRPVADPVWDLYRRTIERLGSVPTLIEWDENLPSWATFEAEARAAEKIMRETAGAGAGDDQDYAQSPGSRFVMERQIAQFV